MLKLDGHKGEVRTVAYLPDGRLVSGGADRTVRVWNPASGECLVMVPAKAPVYALAVEPGTGHVAFAGRNPSKRVTNVVRTFDPATGGIVEQREIRIEESVPVFDRATISYRTEIRLTSQSIWALAYSSDGTYLVAALRKLGGGNDLDGAGGHWWQSTRGSEGALAWNDVYSTTFAPTGMRMAHTREGRVVVVEAPEVNEVAFEYPIRNMWAVGVAFTPSGNELVVAAASYLHFVEIGRAKQSKGNKVKTGLWSVKGIAVSPDGRTVLAGGKPNAVEVYDIASRAKVRSYDFAVGGTFAVAFAPDGLTFAVAGSEGLAVCDFDL